MIDKVLILSASAGAGHVRAAQAIEHAFRETGAAREVTHVDALQYTTALFRRIYSRGYFRMVNRAPGLLGWLYDHFDKPWKHQGRRLVLDRLNSKRLIRLIESTRPDVIVCTHFLPAGIVSWMKGTGRIDSRQAIVVTDYDAHALWLCAHHEQYFVALEETRVYLAKLGMDEARISVTGIPIDPVFSREKDPREMRRKHGLDEDRRTILVSAGGFGHIPVEGLLRFLLEIRHPAQIVAICGRSEKLKDRIEALAREVAPGTVTSLKVVGYTTEMDEYMAASDLLVGKPGGLTVSEALSKGLGFVVVNPIPGQEERNADHLLEEGVAIRANNLPALAYKVDRLLDNPERLAAIQERARRLSRPRAAFEVVERLVNLASSWR